jgi:excisionase family DNA binding protein
METGNDLLTVEEVSAYLRKSPSTVYRLTRQGRLPGRKVGGTWRFSRKGIEEWMRAMPLQEIVGDPDHENPVES